MRWTLLLKLALLILGAYVVDVAVGNLTWLGIIRTGLPLDLATGLGAAVFVLAMILIEGLLSGGARSWARWGLWTLVWLMVAEGSVRVRPSADPWPYRVAILGPVLLAALVLAWRQWTSRGRRRAGSPPLALADDPRGERTDA